MSSDLVAVWEVPCNDGIHCVHVHHGTISGRRLITVDDKEVIRRDWMFRLVGSETFVVGGEKSGAAGVCCQLKIEPCGAFAYQYSLLVDGKPLQRYTERQSRVMCTWLLHGDSDGRDSDGQVYRIVLEKDSLDIWVNGVKQGVIGEFIDNGTANHFTVGQQAATVCAVRVSGGGRRATTGRATTGFHYSLTVNDRIIEPYSETE